MGALAVIHNLVVFAFRGSREAVQSLHSQYKDGNVVVLFRTR
jgi:hypothetical protein